MNLRLLPLSLRRSRPRCRPQMRLDSCYWSSLSKKHAVSSSSKQVLLVHSHLKQPGNHQPGQQQLQQDHRNVAGLSTVAYNDGVHLSPKPQRAAPSQIQPPLTARPQRAAESPHQSEMNSRALPLRERLQIARRTRFQDYNRNRRPASAPPPASNFGSIVSNRLSTSGPPAAQQAQQEDTFSPLVKAIFDLLDQPMPSRKEPLPVPRVKLRNEKEDEWRDEYYHQQRHRYRVYQQAFNTGDARFDSLGRTLCRILRHQATQLGLPIRSNGYVKLDDILNLSISTHAGIAMNAHSVEEVLDVVERDPKQRYSTMVEEGRIYVRANQGHSMRAVVSDHLLTEITSAEQVPVCVHGTYKCFLPSIMKSGLNRMSRNHVHFAIGLPTDEGVLSGMMDTVEVLIYLDVEKALRDGMKLYISDNKVLLTEGFAGVVPCDYFEKVVEWPSFALSTA